MSLPLFFLTVLLSPPDSYPRPQLLMEPDQLAKALPAGKVHVLDAQSKVGYRQGHIPGAVWVDVGAWKQAFRDGKDREGWAKRVGALGIAPDTPVVIYDNSRNNEAARVWWILRYWGFHDVRLLDGGWKAWQAGGGKVEKTPTEPKPVVAKLNPQPARLATKEQLKKGLADRAQVLDARSAAEYEEGCIPGAIRLEWTRTLDPKTGRFKSPEELRKLFKEAGIDLGRPATTYCQSGGRAAVLAFAIEVMGGKGVRNYYRSWGEWGNAKDVPVARPKEKK